jgi:transcriptional regulator with XRE-family HTH domain
MLKLRISEMRKKKGLTQDEVAAFLKITNKTYSAYETGRNNINNETLCLLADFFEVSTDYLLGRQDSIPSFLSEDERNIIKQYRALNKRTQDGIKNSLVFEYSRTAESRIIKESAKSS